MTRINLIHPSELARQHLQGELKEITRVFGLARKAQYEVLRGTKRLPASYTLGTGHVLFFYNKLGFIASRYESLCDEMRRRGYKPNQIPRAELLAGIDSRLHGDYTPTAEAIAINLERINKRLAGDKS